MRKLLFTLFFSLMITGLAIAGDQDFTLTNKTGIEIAEVYVSPASVDNWGEDVLTVDTLSDGQAVDISFSREEDADFWDIKVVDGDGTSVEWPRMKLTEISNVTLSIEKGEPVATYE